MTAGRQVGIRRSGTPIAGGVAHWTQVFSVAPSSTDARELERVRVGGDERPVARHHHPARRSIWIRRPRRFT